MTAMPGSTDPFTVSTYRFDTPSQIEASIRNQVGSIEISADDTAETTVEIIPNDARGAELAERTRVSLSQDGAHLRIDVPDRKVLRQPALEIIVTIPTGSSIDVQTATADVQTRGPLDNASVSTASADVSLADLGGRAQVNTASGDIHVGRSAGPTQVRSASGDVRLDAVATETSVHTASGDLSIGRVSGDLIARSASGDVSVSAASAGSVQAKTMSGDVVIGVAPGLLLWLDVHSLSGDVASELGPDDSVPDDQDGTRPPDLRISASTMSGDVLLRRGR